LIRSSKANLLKRKALRKALDKIFNRLLEVLHIFGFLFYGGSLARGQLLGPLL
jgi:hypothetical protein